MFLGRRSTRARRITYSACAICCWHTQKVLWFEGAVQTGVSSCSCRCTSPADVNARVIVSGEPAHASANDIAVGVEIITRTTTFSTTWLIWRTGRKTLGSRAVDNLPIRALGYALVAGFEALYGPTRTAAALALPTHALLSRCTAVEAFATVILVSLEVYAPEATATLAFRAAANLIISPPNAVLRAALGVPPAFPSQTPAIIRPGYPWEGAKRSS